MTDADLLDDYRWLTSDDAARVLIELAANEQRAPQWRKSFSSQRARLLLEQLALRARASAKFRDAHRLFFTAKGLEQSTDGWIAGYKARRFPEGKPRVDLCCGIGGDLLALAEGGPTEGIDMDPVTAVLAEANLRVRGRRDSRVSRGDVRAWTPAELRPRAGLWHFDPDRRHETPQAGSQAHGRAASAAHAADLARRAAPRRVTQPAWYEPSLDVLERLALAGQVGDGRDGRGSCGADSGGALKLAPAADIPGGWLGEVEREWIGSRRECRQQVIWLGSLAHFPASHVATVVSTGTFSTSGPGEPATASTPATPDESRATQASAVEAASIVGLPEFVLEPVERTRRFLFEPHAAVLAAHLAAALAKRHGLDPLRTDGGYLTGDQPLANPLVSCFEIETQLPFDERRVRRLIRERGIARVEVKKRGVPLDPAALAKRLQHREGDRAATLIVTPLAGRVVAILAHRRLAAGTP